MAVMRSHPRPLRPCLAQRHQGDSGPMVRQASAMPPRERGARGATGPNGCTDPWGHATNGPAPAPCGRVLGSLLPLGHLGRADVIDSVQMMSTALALLHLPCRNSPSADFQLSCNNKYSPIQKFLIDADLIYRLEENSISHELHNLSRTLYWHCKNLHVKCAAGL